GEVHGGRDVRGVPHAHCVRTRRGAPRIEPAGYLRAAWLVPDIERVAQILERLPAGSVVWLRPACAEERWNGEEAAANGVAECPPAACPWPRSVAGRAAL